MDAQQRLLLVEDDDLLRPATARVLARAERAPEVLVDEASSVAEAKALFDAHRYVGGVFDVSLPDGDGMELLAWARGGGWRGRVLVVTGEHDMSLPGRAFLLGAQLVFKPAAPAVLRAFASSTTATALDEAARAVAAEHRFSERQTALLSAYARGASRSDLPALLSVAENTIKTMVRHMLHKTGDRSLDDLLRRVLHHVAAEVMPRARAASRAPTPTPVER